MAGGCNESPDHKYDPYSDVELITFDELAHNSKSIVVLIKQIPNCPLEFPNDPLHIKRKEDAILAQAWTEYLNDPESDPTWLPRLPMVKAGF